MKILAIETASGRCSVALTENNDLLACQNIIDHSMQAEKLISSVQKALSASNLKLQDINYIAVTSGPGSFTGIRIGLATALGLSISTDITPIVVTNFELLNFRIREQARNFDYSINIIDAYRNEYYLQIFDRSNNLIEPPSLLSKDALLLSLAKLEGIKICSGAVMPLMDIRNENLILLPRFPQNDARIVAKVAYLKILKNNFSSNLQPLYIRPPDAKLPLTNGR